jgi:hypothetical protein
VKSKLSAAFLSLTVAACASRHEQQALVAPAPPAGEPADIAGLAPANVRAEFGAPSFVRKDGTAQLWRYDGQSCRAFFFFYDQNGVQAVKHVETLPRGAAMAADTTCLDALRARAKAVS